MNPLVAALAETTERAKASGQPLAARLKMIADHVRVLSTEFAEAVDRFVGRLASAEAGAGAPAIGELLPNFILPDQRGRLVSLNSLLADGPVMIAFLRGHWCPYCRITAAALSEITARAQTSGVQIVAITPEIRQFAQLLDKGDVEGAYPILADLDNGYALSLNLAIWVDEQMSSLIAGAGWDIPAYQGNASSWMLPIPAVFALDRSGVIVARHVNPDYRERADIEQILALLSDLNANGEVRAAE